MDPADAAGEGGPARAQVERTESNPSVALIVDDDKQVRAMLVELLSKAGFRCVEAADGEQALEIVDDHTPHLGVLDLALPGMSGAELAWKLRTRMPGLPIVALSGHLSSWDSDDLEDLGFNRIFPKPMDCDDFVAYCRGVSGGGSGPPPS
jgi:two-component system response regulator (stage 0 sporulation protein F)